jgi:hypothetical protein
LIKEDLTELFCQIFVKSEFHQIIRKKQETMIFIFKFFINFRYIDDKNNYAMSQAIPQQLITRGCYGYYLNRWFDIFPRENIMVLSSSDLLTEPGRVLQKVQEFVGVQVVVDEKNFVWDKGSEHYCIIGPEDLTPKCMGSRKQRSKEFTVNEETKIKLTRIFSSIHRDLSDIVGKELFKSWDMDI